MKQVKVKLTMEELNNVSGGNCLCICFGPDNGKSFTVPSGQQGSLYN